MVRAGGRRRWVGPGVNLRGSLFASAGAPNRRLNRWRVLTIALIMIGYAGYYLCRSDFAVAMPLLIAELGRKGIPPDVARIRLGTIASLGVLAYAIGKFPSGWLADFLAIRGQTHFSTGTKRVSLRACRREKIPGNRGQPF